MSSTRIISGIIGNLILAGTFLMLMLDQSEYKHFIASTGLLIFIAEVLSIFASALALGLNRSEERNSTSAVFEHLHPAMPKIISAIRLGKRLFLLGFYLVFALSFLLIFKNSVFILWFTLSSSIKIMGGNLNQNKRMVVYQLLFFMLTTSIITIIAGYVLGKPTSNLLSCGSGGGCGGLFIEAPWALLWWGITYYSGLALSELYFYCRPSALTKLLPGK
ncbi:MAG: hypothetical protein COV10_04795 [Candidatus Vogelbacteria bacterium CG10_big_fil_rev_8_21_14_0_10_51_16]|uniref:Uncharacterized protein n=1 Tax=Candidatus Vogelbacteria bacterium CG10_big_fil_rev_8_21_14_0_10_51_16 TaxID=1975045 RepID=A0A2H0RD73_9BACT|nr:MAG: hypothetical protein COV10_04795 [Candidatus Vogelbacteria bacterium CG10_big_fil_rev_8_21_14_0_10_51_16]